jgi:hypothetical protein
MPNEYHEGDKVRIKRNAHEIREVKNIGYTSAHKELEGQTVTISLAGTRNIQIAEVPRDWWISPEAITKRGSVR